MITKKPQTEQIGDWWPSAHQLKTPEDTERAFRQLLDQFYALRNSHSELKAQVKNGANKEAVPAQTNTASITRVLGLPVEPSDTTQLADGTVLTYVAATRSFRFL